MSIIEGQQKVKNKTQRKHNDNKKQKMIMNLNINGIRKNFVLNLD